MDQAWEENLGRPMHIAIHRTQVAANAALAFNGQYIDNLPRHHAIAMDVSDQDRSRFDVMKLHQIPDSYDIANVFEIYHGTHISAVADRFQNPVIPFFSRNLCYKNLRKP